MTDAATIAPLWAQARDLDSRIQMAEDRTAVHRLLIDLQTAMDRREIAKFASSFTDDGEWCVGSLGAAGPREIAQAFGRRWKPWDNEAQRTYHSLSDVIVDIDGDTAAARGQWRHDCPGETWPFTSQFGRFDARLRRGPEGWKFEWHAMHQMLPYCPAECRRPERLDELGPARSESRSTPHIGKLDMLRQALEGLAARIRAAEDRDAVHRLFVDVQSAMDGRDLVGYGQMYLDDGEWCAVNGRAIGPANITEHLRQYCRPWERETERSYHSFSDVTIDLNADTATGHAQWQHVHPGDDGRPVAKCFGQFDAVARRTPDGWRLKRRASYSKIPYVEPNFQLLGLAPEGADRPASPGARATSAEAGEGAASSPEELGAELDRLDERFRHVEDREAIYRLFIRLQDATDARDGIAYAECFTEDGEWSGVSGKAVGRAEIARYMVNYMTPWEGEAQRTFHSISDLTIDLDGDVATARAQYRHFRLGEDGFPEPFHFCHYESALRRTSDGWLFKRRASYIDIPFVAPKFQIET